jgi:hypothetical protein
MLGAPEGVRLDVRATPGPAREMGAARLLPVPAAKVVSDGPGVRRLEPVYREAAAAYRRADFLPGELAAIALDGRIRDRRVAQLELRPVQYQPSTGRVRVYARIIVRVDFLPTSGAPSWTTTSSPESREFDEYFARDLINNTASRAWRAPRPRPPASPAIADDRVWAVKCFIAREGVYRVDGRTLQAHDVDLRAVRPRDIRMTFRGQEIPVHVHGEGDGRFDPQDYVEFLGERPTTPYSRWNVYWIIAGNRPGLRVAEQEGAPRNSLATLVPSFRSQLHLEDNLLHSILQHVTPEQMNLTDPHDWFEARDHWFWFGVKNGVDRNEAALQFPLYDVAKTFDPSRVDILLQGGTPVPHDILVSFNEAKVARAIWPAQEELLVGRSLPADNLRDVAVATNELRLTRVDTNEDEDTDNYPYHVYVNRLRLEYTRLFLAVGDELFFSTPPADAPLDVRRRRTLEYSIGDFVGEDVAVYEHNSSHLLARLRNVEVSRQRASREQTRRLHAIQAARGEPLSSPEWLATARFQAQDTHDARYVAVSSQGVRRPDRIEPDTPSRLGNPNNGADYVLIYHPRFAAAAQRLAEWRRTPRGGAYRVAAVSVTDIYDEFGDGMVTPRAIKAFLTYAFQYWEAPPLTHVAILGDGTFDFFGVDRQRYPDAPELLGYIPTHYVWTLFGQTSTDHWFTTVSGIDPLPDFYLGRLSVESEEQADAVVEKIVRYEGSPPNGSWRRRIVSVADDDTTNSGDFIFKQSLNDISQNHTLLGYQTVKVFLEDIMDAVEADPDKYRGRRPAQIAREMIVDALSDGAIISQYAGHGGRLVWAHEIIFDNPGIRTLRPTPRLSLMLVLSCYNGYFDAPADPSMAEALTRLPNAGIIGMISATRLTFGSGNDALNRLIFDDIFARNMRSLGEIAFVPKTRLMVNQGLSHLEVMQQYSLFGDPATRLSMADYEVRPEIPQRSVRPGGELRIAPGRVLRADYDRAFDAKTYTPVDGFSGRLVVTVRFTAQDTGLPMEVAAEATVTNGAYPEMALRVPANARAGRAQVEYYAESADALAVGGSTFAVSEPVIESVDVRVGPNGNIALAVQATDDREITSVAVEWYSREQRQWIATALAPDPSRGKGFFALREAVPAPAAGDAFEYVLRVTDADGNVVETEPAEFLPRPLPDWRVLLSESDRQPLIAYEDTPSDGGRLSARIENLTDVRPDTPLPVSFYLGNPDLDEDDTPDADAHRIASVEIAPASWEKGDPLAANPMPGSRLRRTDTPLNTRWTAGVEARHTLAAGRHPIFVWVDPPTGPPPSDVREAQTRNNLTGRVIEVSNALIGPSGGTAASLDGSFRVDVSGRAFPAPQVVGVGASASVPAGQSLVTPLPAFSGSGAYTASPAGAVLPVPAVVEALFDLDAVRRDIQRRLGLEEVRESALTDEQRRLISEGVRTELSAGAVYTWRPAVQKWRRLSDSLLLRDAQQNPVARRLFSAVSGTTGSGLPAEIAIESENVRLGEWVAFFRGPATYDLYHRADTGAIARIAEGLSPLASVDDPIPSAQSHLPFVVRAPADAALAFGDVVKFQTVAGGLPNAPAVVRAIRRSTVGTGVFQSIAVEGGATGQTGVSLALLFLSPRTFQVARSTGGFVETAEGPRLGSIGEEWYDPALGLRFTVLAGDTPFEPGDTLRLLARTAGVFRATTDSLGTFALFLTTDTSPPVATVTVAGQDFAEGDPVSPNPALRVVVSDDSGVDPEDVALALSRDGGDFLPVPPDQRQTHATAGAREVLVNYNPSLEPGDYVLRVSARDVEGHEAEREVAFRVTRTSELRSVLNYPNPFRTYTDIAVEATGEVESLSVRIYSLQGRLVWAEERPPTAGFVRVRWEGRDSEGREVANGVYYARVRMTARGKVHTETIKLLKMR